MDPGGLILREATRGFAAGAAAWGAAWGGSVSEVPRPELLGASLAWLASLAAVGAAGWASGRRAAPATSGAPASADVPARAPAAALEAPASAAQLAAAQEGDFILVEYVGYANVWHERLVVLAPDGSSLACTLTPDDDSYEEDLFAVAEVRRWLPCEGGRMGAYPPAAAGMHVHGFRGVPAPARVAQVLAAGAARMGVALGAEDTVVPNLALQAVPAPGLAPLASRRPEAQRQRRSQLVAWGRPLDCAPALAGPPPPLVAAPAAAGPAAADGGRGAAAAAAAPVDARIQPVTYDLQGQRHAGLANFRLVHTLTFRAFMTIMLVLWLVTLNKELESVFTMTHFCMNYPSSEDQDALSPLRIPRSDMSWHVLRSKMQDKWQWIRDWRAGELHLDGDSAFFGKQRITISDISPVHRVTCWCVWVLRLVNLFYMLAVGIVYATCTHSYVDLLMNTVALAFVFELPELFYLWLVPEQIKDTLNRVELAPFDDVVAESVSTKFFNVSLHGAASRARFVQGLALIPLICVSIVQANDVWQTLPMLEVLRCACEQSGPECAVGKYLQREWWNAYWNRSHEIISKV
ncbi:unnamed protein product [Prorocentrum cordatum]|uniref:Sphingomyelin synthase-like domain-containing protein n=1 Tax=Prorocentrum cordatum TaxID=2364126 RepID=A0ABN9TVD7_9DINO|nr:unnamed protein product [Polarella glacialis]